MHLKGITWNHTRGKLPVLATAQRYMEMHPGVTIDWQARSLKEFGDAPIDILAQDYDLIILDHPWMGFAAENKILLPLEHFLEPEFLADQKANSVGKSFQSYNYTHQYALAIDAACPIAFYSNEKLKADNASLPTTWSEVIDLAKRGKVYCGGNGTSILMQFYMLLATKTDEKLFVDGIIADKEIQKESLLEIQELFSYLPNCVFSKNPIGVYEVLASPKTEYYYCPCDFGYSNYSRVGYSSNLITSANVVKYNGKMLKTTLGGAGFAISNKCKNIELALDYLKYTASGEIQQSIYVENGGQPGHRSAWTNSRANELTNSFFNNTLETLDNAYLRPRYDGYLSFQETAGPLIRDWIMNEGNVDELIDNIHDLFIYSI